MPGFSDALKNRNAGADTGSQSKQSKFSSVVAGAKAESAANKAENAAKKSNEEIAKEVISGNWGVGQERKDKLTAAGYDYSAVQSIVNELMKK